GLGCLAGYRVWQSRRGLPPTPESPVAEVERPSQDGPEADPTLGGTQAQEVAEVPEVGAPEAEAPVAPTAVQTDSGVGPGAPGEAETTRAEATPYTRQLVANLTQLDLGGGSLTAEQAEQWKV